ncbi:MAG: hypothetical protein V2I33_17500 [Kangiellaceae bacterium]|jgi:hypothetical protein|nr:hypothetical protein [Kangiellaceae bacterium]
MAEVAAVAVKLPTFWTTNATAWFAQAEAQFQLRNIVQDDTRYYYVVAALDAETSNRATLILQRPPADEKYAKLKKFLLNSFEPSEAERAEQLLNMGELGDRKPTELMDKILQLNGTSDQHFLLRQIFIRALPVPLKQAVATLQEDDLQSLAMEADRISVCCKTQFSINEASEDALEIDVVAKRRQRRQLCFFHQKFGTSARRCQQPCDWKPYAPNSKPGNARVSLC